jgi:DHA1 family multidrug resistance protein-like MFS transporter
VLYVNLYTALAYGVLYRESPPPLHPIPIRWPSSVWFEAFPLVYVGIYHFNLGESGLPFLGLLVSSVLTSIAYVGYNYYYVEPRFRSGISFVPEDRMLVALVASVFIPTSLFIFGKRVIFLGDGWILMIPIIGWTARANVHWIAPTIGAGLYLPG